VKDITPASISSADLGLNMWRSLADAIPDMLVVVDRRGKIAYLNHTPPGFTRQQFAGTGALDYVPAGSRKELEESLHQIFATGNTRRREQRIVLPDNTERWYSLSAGPVLIEKEVAAAIIVARDITESKRAQFAVAESEARYRTLVEYAPEAIVVFDIDACRFTEANQNACALFDLSRDALLRSNPMALSPDTQPDGRQSDSLAWDHIMSALDGEVPCFDWTHRRSDGAEVRCQVRLVKMPSLDRRLVRASITDVTQQRKFEHQLQEWQKMDALGQLAGSIAHDFNNLLTVMMVRGDLLLRALKDDEMRHDAEEVVEAARKAALLTSQLLWFARRQPVEGGMLDLNEVVRTMSAIVDRLIGPDISLVLDLDPAGAPARIGRSQVEQVVMNLLTNAHDAIVHSGTIYLSTGRDEDPRYTRLRVSDTGPGIAPEIRRRMFEPFFTTKGKKGTGLGLSTVYGIVTQVGGRIDVRDEIAEGATIDILLPKK
jgi:two-component system cell cycle sensor histidine kinase/response regulator CckA